VDEKKGQTQQPRSRPAQERGLLVLIAAALLASGFLVLFDRPKAPPGWTNAPIELADVRVVIPTFLDAASQNVNVNTASADELTRLSGIGPVLAGRIVAYREAHGPFASIDALTEVSGIGPETVERLRDRAVVASDAP